MPKKNGWYYAASDVGGAITWGSAGTSLGPLGTAVGIVIGGVGTSAWNWYWDQPDPPKKVKAAEATWTHKYDNFYEKSGYIHNESVIEFVDQNDRIFTNTTEFVNSLYDTLSESLAQEYGLSINEVHDIFSQPKLINDLDRFSEIFDFETEAYIEGIVEITREKYSSPKIPDYLKEILFETSQEQDNSNFDIKGYFDQKIEEIRSGNYFDEVEKEILSNSLNIFKYSYEMWRDNV